VNSKQRLNHGLGNGWMSCVIQCFPNKECSIGVKSVPCFLLTGAIKYMFFHYLAKNSKTEAITTLQLPTFSVDVVIYESPKVLLSCCSLVVTHVYIYISISLSLTPNCFFELLGHIHTFNYFIFFKML